MLAELARGLPVDLAGPVDAHPPRRRPGVAPPPRSARAGAGQGRRRRRAHLDRRLGLVAVQRHVDARSTAATGSRRARRRPAALPPATSLVTSLPLRRSRRAAGRARLGAVQRTGRVDRAHMGHDGHARHRFGDCRARRRVHPRCRGRARACPGLAPGVGHGARRRPAADHVDLRRRRRSGRRPGDRARAPPPRPARHRPAHRADVQPAHRRPGHGAGDDRRGRRPALRQHDGARAPRR